MSFAELCTAAADLRGRALRARELADHLADQEARRGALRYADDLDQEAGRLEARTSTIRRPEDDRRRLDAARRTAHSFLLASRASRRIAARLSSRQDQPPGQSSQEFDRQVK
jgi:hypothetical protein